MAADVGSTVMEAAIANFIGGIEAQCYGGCNCGTCHVYIDAAWVEVVGPPKPWEGQMLQSVSLAKSNSRLSCQVSVSAALDGLVVHTPEYQG